MSTGYFASVAYRSYQAQEWHVLLTLSHAHSYVRIDLPLSRTDQADLTVHANVYNTASTPVTGMLRARITRDGMGPIEVDTQVSLAPGESREIKLSPQAHAALRVDDPELWWPYIWGKPTLHHLSLEFETSEGVSDQAECDFGIRMMTGHRDDTAMRPQYKDPSSFYLKINGRDYLIRGAGYTPELLLTRDYERAWAKLRYSKDMGINLIRWEGHFVYDGLLEMCDREGMPTMFGLMCCGSWERWGEWDQENHRIAQASVRDSIYRLRSHASIAISGHASDGLPPPRCWPGTRPALSRHLGKTPYQFGTNLGSDHVLPIWGQTTFYWLTKTEVRLQFHPIPRLGLVVQFSIGRRGENQPRFLATSRRSLF